MKNGKCTAFECLQVVIAVLLAGLFSVFPAPAGAQTGPNAVYNSGGTCCGPSTAFIDASVFAGSGTNFCGVIYGILTNKNFTPGAGSPFPVATNQTWVAPLLRFLQVWARLAVTAQSPGLL